MFAIPTGKNRLNEIMSVVGAGRQVPRILDNLEELRLIERLLPVTDDPRLRTGRTSYRLADNLLAFWLELLAPCAFAYVTNTAAAEPRGSVSIIDAEARQVVATIEVGSEPKRIQAVEVPLG